MKKKMLFEEKIIGIALCLMVIMVAAQVFSRYVVHKSLSYTEELVRYLFIWITFLGASAVVFRRRHLSIAGALRIIPSGMKKWISFISGTFAVILSAVLVIYGIKVVLLQMQTGQTTAAMGLPMWIIGLAIPICSIIIIFRIFMIALKKGNRE